MLVYTISILYIIYAQHGEFDRATHESSAHPSWCCPGQQGRPQSRSQAGHAADQATSGERKSPEGKGTYIYIYIDYGLGAACGSTPVEYHKSTKRLLEETKADCSFGGAGSLRKLSPKPLRKQACSLFKLRLICLATWVTTRGPRRF